MLRIFGLKEETTYGVKPSSIQDNGEGYDFHRRLSDGEFKLNDEPVKYSGGSRMVQGARPGAVKPTGSTEGKCDLKRVGYYLKAFFDQYKYTNGSDDELNTHEFWGGESNDLKSFTGVATFDYFEKVITGLMLDELSFDVSTEYLTQKENWVYQNETMNPINEDTYEFRDIEGAIPLMFYDIDLELNDTAMNNVIFKSFKFEGKNNINQDGTIGLGSRFPQRKASAQAREIDLEVGSNLDKGSDFIKLLKGAEYGSETATTPTGCLIYKVPLKVTVKTCEDDYTESLVMYFPKSTVNVEYSAKESDEIEVTFKLAALGTGSLTNFKEFKTSNPLPNVKTDCYCVLKNDVNKIGA